jgi:hypothetical protein
MEKINLKSMHCCYLITKTISGLKKYKGNGPKMNFQICKFLSFFGPLYHAFISLHMTKHQLNLTHVVSVTKSQPNITCLAKSQPSLT